MSCRETLTLLTGWLVRFATRALSCWSTAGDKIFDHSWLSRRRLAWRETPLSVVLFFFGYVYKINIFPYLPDMGGSPIVKWAGGKTRLLRDLRQRVPSRFSSYFEPFAGGAALFHDLEPAQATLGDSNPDLIAMYFAVATNVDGVIAGLVEHRAAYRDPSRRPGYYYTVRDAWNAGKFAPGVAAAAAFIFLNKTGFNGLWRVNKSGKLNNPEGHYVNPSIFDEKEFRAAALRLAKVSLVCAPFERTVESAQPGDFVYFDPPYDPLKKTSSFTGYAKEGFGDRDQERLAQVARLLHAQGVSIMLSNNDTPFIRRLYDGFVIEVVESTRPISGNAKGRGKVPEVLITGAP